MSVSFDDVYLGKWPRLVVAGDRVTPEQADEIIIRTTDLHGLWSNDQEWNRRVHGVLGVREDDLDDAERVNGELGYLGLRYLDNHRISSCWIGGPHGWCDWDGTVGCSSFNVGKWPECDEVEEDLKRIAGAFPYLSMTVQLLPNEGADGEPVAAQWRVESGGVERVEAGLRLIDLLEPEMFKVLLRGGERGVGLRRLRRAVARVRQQRRGIVATP